MSMLRITKEEYEDGRCIIKNIMDSNYDQLEISRGLDNLESIARNIFRNPDIVVCTFRKILLARQGDKALRLWRCVEPGNVRDFVAIFRKIFG